MFEDIQERNGKQIILFIKLKRVVERTFASCFPLLDWGVEATVLSKIKYITVRSLIQSKRKVVIVLGKCHLFSHTSLYLVLPLYI